MDDNYLKIIGERIRSIRLDLGRTQKEQAEMLGVKPNAWSQYESGDVDMPVSKLIGIAASLGHPVHYFVENMPHNDVDYYEDFGLSKASRISRRVADIKILLEQITMITAEGTPIGKT